MRRPGRRDGAITLFHVVLAVVVAAAAVAGYLIYTSPRLAAPPKVAVAGDSVKVDYIGKFNDSTVFDTSLKAVANDNTTYPKAPVYGYRGDPTPLSFTLGANAVVPGFDQNVTGMREGQTKTFTLPPSLAYGASDPHLLEVRNLTQVVKWTEKMSPNTFRSTFNLEPPSKVATVTDPEWGWNVTVYPQSTFEDQTITIVRLADPGTNLRPFNAWQARVVSVDTASNAIVVQHLLTPTDAGKIVVRTGANPFILSRVGDGTFTLDHNQPLGLRGQYLTFTVTLVSVTKPGTTGA